MTRRYFLAPAVYAILWTSLGSVEAQDSAPAPFPADLASSSAVTLSGVVLPASEIPNGISSTVSGPTSETRSGEPSITEGISRPISVSPDSTSLLPYSVFPTVSTLTTCEGPECRPILTMADTCPDEKTLNGRIAALEQALKNVNDKISAQFERLHKNDGFENPKVVDKASLLAARIARLKDSIEKSKENLKKLEAAAKEVAGEFDNRIQGQKNNIALDGVALGKAEEELKNLKTDDKDAKIAAGEEQMKNELAKMKELTDTWQTLTLQLHYLMRCKKMQ